MGRLKVLEIDNFKSYAGSQVSLAPASSEHQPRCSFFSFLFFCLHYLEECWPFQAVSGGNRAEWGREV